MKFLVRSEQPKCLADMKKRYKDWGDVTHSDKATIWLSLDEMQNNYCAFCEMSLKGMRKHIEHFVARHRNNVLTFDWANLFGSCDNSEHCGRYKDTKISDYDENNLIKPDEIDAKNLLFFSPEGDIDVKKGLVKEEYITASETIRVFGLDAPNLIAARRIILKSYTQTAKEFVELIELASNENDMNELITEICSEYDNLISDQSFSTALRQLIEF